MLIPDLKKIVLDFAKIKNEDKTYKNYCHRCCEFKCQSMKNLDIMFYQIKLSFILDKVFSPGTSNEFQEIIQNSDIQTDKHDHKRYGWVTNSIDIENYWYKSNNIVTVEDIIINKITYLEFINNNFEFIEERNINFCDKCWLNGKKIKMD